MKSRRHTSKLTRSVRSAQKKVTKLRRSLKKSVKKSGSKSKRTRSLRKSLKKASKRLKSAQKKSKKYSAKTMWKHNPKNLKGSRRVSDLSKWEKKLYDKMSKSDKKHFLAYNT
jgi:hypothetical protein